MEIKGARKSKTLGVAAALPLLTLVPGVKDVVVQYPQESVGILSAIFAVLRIVTKGKIGGL